MARRTKKKVSPTVSARSKNRRVKNAGKKGGTRVIPNLELMKLLGRNAMIDWELRSGDDPYRFMPGKFSSENIPISMTKTPSGLLLQAGAGAGRESPRIVLPTDVKYWDIPIDLKEDVERLLGPSTREDLDRVATWDWKEAEKHDGAINAIEEWGLNFKLPSRDIDYVHRHVLPSISGSRDDANLLSAIELRAVANDAGRMDLIPRGGPIYWTSEQIAEAQEAITDSTGHQFGERDPTFVAPVTEEGWAMLDEIYKEGVAPKRSSNPQTPHVTPRMKKIAAQIDRQLADLPQNATLTDRQVQQILAAIAA